MPKSYQKENDKKATTMTQVYSPDLANMMKNIGQQARDRRKRTVKESGAYCNIVGIDLGTTTSCCAVWKAGEVKVYV
jgi:hypothetical protein